jgi:tRNA A37 N6-isopentenylltransferase MiaA
MQDIIDKWKYHEHAYARRQMTWFKKQSDIRWFDLTEPGWEERITGTVDTWYTFK